MRLLCVFRGMTFERRGGVGGMFWKIHGSLVCRLAQSQEGRVEHGATNPDEKEGQIHRPGAELYPMPSPRVKAFSAAHVKLAKPQTAQGTQLWRVVVTV